MAMTQSSIITAADFNALKKRVKDEMTRRNGNGDLSGYAAPAYDYTTVPGAGVAIKEEHYDKIRDLMANIKSAAVSLGAKTVGDIIVAMNTLEANMTTFEAQQRGAYATSGNGDCAAACSGMCVTQCTTTCSGGCTSCTSCTGTCSGCTGCSGGCDGCSGCGSGCSGTCSGGCSNDCAAGCNGNCTGGCSNSCAITCSPNCTGSCGVGCGTCSGTCVGGCGSGCMPTYG